MGMRQATQLLGPLLAGAVIAVFGDGNVRLGHSYRGLAVAFLIDCATFLLSAATLYKVASHSQMPGTSQSQGVFASIRNGLQALWRDQGLRAICLYSAATAFLTGGPVQVALPVVADRNLSNGAAAYGSMLAAYGAGSLIGMAVSGARPTWRLRSLGATILLIDAVAAFVLMPLGKIETVWQGVFLVGALGVLGGLIQVGVYSWIQRRVEPAMIGRAMSLFMFIFVGLAPLSAALTGWLLTIVTLERLFLGAGITLLAIILAALVGGGMAQVGGEPVCAPVAGKVASGA
jgi:Major Facilitator Superfamily